MARPVRIVPAPSEESKVNLLAVAGETPRTEARCSGSARGPQRFEDDRPRRMHSMLTPCCCQPSWRQSRRINLLVANGRRLRNLKLAHLSCDRTACKPGDHANTTNSSWLARTRNQIKDSMHSFSHQIFKLKHNTTKLGSVYRGGLWAGRRGPCRGGGVS
jgi:hypothetical protein